MHGMPCGCNMWSAGSQPAYAHASLAPGWHAGATPVSSVTASPAVTVGCRLPHNTHRLQGSAIETLCDWTLGLAIPVHMHISTNALVTDYVAKAARGG
jgi:hypothetical protein